MIGVAAFLFPSPGKKRNVARTLAEKPSRKQNTRENGKVLHEEMVWGAILARFILFLV